NPMDESIRAALQRGGVIDITTTGRRTGDPRRIEIVFHPIDDRIWISGMPSPKERAWISNLAADPRLTVHLKGPVTADLPARALPGVPMRTRPASIATVVIAIGLALTTIGLARVLPYSFGGVGEKSTIARDLWAHGTAVSPALVALSALGLLAAIAMRPTRG